MLEAQTESRLKTISPFLKPGARVTERPDYLETVIERESEGLKANAYYFNNSVWAEENLTYCHRSEEFRSRWSAKKYSLVGKAEFKDRLGNFLSGRNPGKLESALTLMCVAKKSLSE